MVKLAVPAAAQAAQLKKLQTAAEDRYLALDAYGVVEYTNTAFGGAIKNRLLITEFSNGDDIIAVTLNSSGGVSGIRQIIAGFNNPLGIATNARHSHEVGRGIAIATRELLHIRIL